MGKVSKEAKARWNKENTVMMSLRFMKTTDGDIIKKLESVPSKQGYVKTLIRKDIARTDTEQPPGL